MANETLGRRRYKIGKYPLYDQTFDRLVDASLILNPTGSGANDVRNFGTISLRNSREGIKRLLMEYQGDNGSGFYIQNRREIPSKLKEAKHAIEAIKEKFAKLKQRAVNAGRYPPKKMDAELKELLLKAEAREDIIRAEIKRLQNGLENFPDEKTGELMPCLKYGCIGSSKNTGGICTIIDGQSVEPDEKGVLRIKDERSPFHGMRTADYFQSIVQAYNEQRAKLSNEHQIAVSQAVKENKDPAAIAKKRPPLPGWPDGVERFDWKE